MSREKELLTALELIIELRKRPGWTAMLAALCAEHTDRAVAGAMLATAVGVLRIGDTAEPYRWLRDILTALEQSDNSARQRLVPVGPKKGHEA